MQRKFFIFCIAFLFACCSSSFAENKKQDSKSNKSQRVVTITESQFDDIMRKMDSMQREIDSLKLQLENSQSAEKASSVVAETSRPSNVAGEKAEKNQDGISEETSPADDESVLKELQSQQQLSDTDVTSGNSAKLPESVSNPKISINGDFLWNINNNPNVEGDSPFQVREIEFAFQDNIDPWSKADIFAGLKKEDGEYVFELEEAYLTLNKLPLTLQARVGQMRLPFGKDNEIHQHALPYVDRPDVIHNFFGEEGQKGIGLEMSGILPMGKVYAEFTGAVVKNLASSSFDENANGKPMYLERGRLFSDLSDSSNIELGYSNLSGYNDVDTLYNTTVQGVDFTYRWKPLDAGNYRSIMLRGEYLWSKRFAEDGVLKSKGYYAFGQYQLNKNWFLGGRYDYSEQPQAPELSSHSYSAILTYYPTEYCYYRLQYKNVMSNFEPKQNQWLFQINFLMGPHGAHKF